MIKKITLLSVMALLCLNFCVYGQANKAVDVTAKGIQIGQPVPDVAINNIHHYKTTTAKISDFKGKLLILDFWATWCSPCVAMIPKMDSLQKAFGDKLQFLSVTYQSGKEVLPFLEKLEKQQKKHYNLPVVTDSKELHLLFPHTTLPHYVWIDGNGKVVAITGQEEVNIENIDRFFAHGLAMHTKKDMKIAYIPSKPLLFNGNGGTIEKLLYHTMLTGYLDGLEQSFSVTAMQDTSGRKLTCKNLGILKLFALAHGGDQYYFGRNRIEEHTTQQHVYRSGKNLTGNALTDWMANGHAFSYEAKLPPGSGELIFEVMKRDIALNFPTFIVEVQRKIKKCWVLELTSGHDKIKTRGAGMLNRFSPMGCKVVNSSLPLFLSRLERLYLQKTHPLVDATGYAHNVDIELATNLADIALINTELAKYDLRLTEKDWPTEILVVKDNPNSNTFLTPIKGGNNG